MDYKTTYKYFFKTTQNRLSYILQSELSKSLEKGRPFSYVDQQVLQFYKKQLDNLKERWNYREFKPIIDLIGLRNSYYSKHALNKILSNEVREKFDQLELNMNYKCFIAKLAQLQSTEEGYYNYINNNPYFDRCYQTDGINQITFLKISDHYTNLDDFHLRGKKLYGKNRDVGNGLDTPKISKKSKNDTLKDSLTEDEKVIIIQILFDLKVPLNKLLKAPELYRLLFLTDGLFDNRIIENKLSNLSVYRKLGNHVAISKNLEREKIEKLIQKLRNLKVDSIIPELRKLLSKTI